MIINLQKKCSNNNNYNIKKIKIIKRNQTKACTNDLFE